MLLPGQPAARSPEAGFVAIDDLLLRPDARGAFLVRLGGAAQLASLCAHAVRRAESGSRRSLRAVVAAVPPVSLWREAALRSRPGDLPLLARHLLARIAEERGEARRELSGEALALLRRHRWPGNVRELDNALRVASLFADGDTVEAEDLARHVEALRAATREGRGARLPPDAPSAAEATEAVDRGYAELRAGKVGLFDLKRQIERDCIARALAETQGNITKAASLLGMKRPRLSQLVKQYGLTPAGS